MHARGPAKGAVTPVLLRRAKESGPSVTPRRRAAPWFRSWQRLAKVLGRPRLPAHPAGTRESALGLGPRPGRPAQAGLCHGALPERGLDPAVEAAFPIGAVLGGIDALHVHDFTVGRHFDGPPGVAVAAPFDAGGEDIIAIGQALGAPHRERVAAEVNVQHQARLAMDLVEGQHLAAAVTMRRSLTSAACIAVVEDDERGGVAVVDVVLVREPGDGITGGEGEVSVAAQAPDDLARALAVTVL